MIIKEEKKYTCSKCYEYFKTETKCLEHEKTCNKGCLLLRTAKDLSSPFNTPQPYKFYLSVEQARIDLEYLNNISNDGYFYMGITLDCVK